MKTCTRDADRLVAAAMYLTMRGADKAQLATEATPLSNKGV